MARVRVKVHRSGIMAINRSAKVLAFLESKAQGIVDKANAEAPNGANYMVYSTVGATRARAAAQTGNWESVVHNAETNALLKASGGGDYVAYTSKSGKTSLITRKQAENYSRGRR